jgi:hypothetical protein
VERRVTTLRYFGRNRGQATVRQIEPLRLGHAAGAWYLTGLLPGPSGGACLPPGSNREPASGNRAVSPPPASASPGRPFHRRPRTISRRHQPLGTGAAALVIRRRGRRQR